MPLLLQPPQQLLFPDAMADPTRDRRDTGLLATVSGALATAGGEADEQRWFQPERRSDPLIRSIRRSMRLLSALMLMHALASLGGLVAGGLVDWRELRRSQRRLAGLGGFLWKHLPAAGDLFRDSAYAVLLFRASRDMEAALMGGSREKALGRAMVQLDALFTKMTWPTATKAVRMGVMSVVNVLVLLLR